MPFLPPNQQRQSTENVTVTLCIRLAGACSRGQMSERGGAGECRSFSDTVPAMTQVNGRASTRRPARACCRYVTGYCRQSYTPPPLHATTASEMTYTVSGGALNSTQTKPTCHQYIAPFALRAVPRQWCTPTRTQRPLPVRS